MREIKALAHGKVNLHLGVGPLRDDGYHDLVTIFQSLSLHDVVTITETAQPGVQRLFCTTRGVPVDENNLAWQAAERLLAGTGRGVEIHIEKGIPTAGGMAGGSADAAATLIAVNKLLEGKFSTEQLLEIAADLGSDVPFTLIGGTAEGTGRGEMLTPVLSRGQYHWVLVLSPEGLATPEVFNKLDQLERSPQLDTTALKQALLSGDPHHLAPLLHNDMQPVALSLRPDLRKTLMMGEQAAALAGIVSGSGPTCAFLCDSAEHAQDVAAELSLTHKVAVAHGPSQGAQLL